MIPTNLHHTFALALVGAFLASPVVCAQQQQPPAPPPMPTGPIEVNGIAAKVNGRVITKNQVNFLLAPVYAQLVTEYPRRGPQFEAKFKEKRTAVLQELIDRQIILDEFKQMGAFIKPNIVDDEIKRQMREAFNGDEAKFREELRRSRMTMEGYREMTREKMVVQSMRSRQFSEEAPPLPGEIRKEYDEIKSTLRDVTKDKISFQKIFIPAMDPTNPLSTPDLQLALAEDIAKQISNGKDFGELAKTKSQDAFAENGGIQENVPRTDLSPEFAAIIFDAPIGKVLGPLLDRQGFTIVKPLKVDLGPAPSMDEKVREMVAQRVRVKKSSQQYERWIEGKRKRAMIKIEE
jgi:peptidyl-prolyl cis-trans isomerase SurA